MSDPPVIAMSHVIATARVVLFQQGDHGTRAEGKLVNELHC